MKEQRIFYFDLNGKNFLLGFWCTELKRLVTALEIFFSLQNFPIGSAWALEKILFKRCSFLASLWFTPAFLCPG